MFNRLKRNFDVIIVGAGPAGSSTATFLAERGYNVLLVDKEKFPRDKICGDGISSSSLKYLSEMGIRLDELKKKFQNINYLLLSSPNGKEALIRLKNMEGLIIPRKKFDYILVKNAVKKGVNFIEKFKVTQLLFKKNKGKLRVIGVKGIKENKIEIFESKVVVAADGTHSTIARILSQYGRRKKDRFSAIAVRGYFKKVKELRDCIEIYFEKHILPGYGWIFPVNQEVANIGIAIDFKNFKKKKKPIIKLLYDFIEKNEKISKRLKNAVLESELKGWKLSYESHPTKKYYLGVVFVGDAASLIDPLSGEGISNALLSGKLAANAIHLAFQKNNLDYLREYVKEWDKQMKKSLFASVILRYFLSFPFIVNFLIKKAQKDRKLASILGGCIVGAFPKTKIFSFNVLKKII